MPSIIFHTTSLELAERLGKIVRDSRDSAFTINTDKGDITLYDTHYIVEADPSILLHKMADITVLVGKIELNSTEYIDISSMER